MKYILILVLLFSSLLAQTPIFSSALKSLEYEKLLPDDITTYSQFGQSVAIEGDVLVIGSFKDKCLNGEPNCGSVTVYTFNNTTGIYDETKTLRANDEKKYNHFGCSVAISGNTLVIGSYKDDDLASNSGAVYVFEKLSFQTWLNSWQATKLKAPNGHVNDYFGFSVDISDNAIIIGSYADDTKSNNAGSAYLFFKPSSGFWVNSSIKKFKITAPNSQANDLFGYSVAIDKSRIIIGAYADDVDGVSNAGSAHLFGYYYFRGILRVYHQKQLTAIDPNAYANFGRSVDILGSSIIIGADGNDENGLGSGAAYIFNKDPSASWSELSFAKKLMPRDGKSGNWFGYDVAISQNTIVVGSYLDDNGKSNSGSAYVFKKKPIQNWSNSLTSKKITSSDSASGDLFGVSVGVDNDTVLVGANGNDDKGYASGSSYVFGNTLSFEVSENTNAITKIEAHGLIYEPISYTIIGGKDASFFRLNQNSHNLSFKYAANYENPRDSNKDNVYELLVKAETRSQESSIVKILVKVNDLEYEGMDPTIYTFSPLSKLLPVDSTYQQKYGNSVAIHGDITAISTLSNNPEDKVVYLYKYNSNTRLYHEIAKLRSSDASSNNDFGKSIAFDNNTIIVGASNAVYVYEKPSNGNWINATESVKLTSPKNGESDNFASSIALQENTIVVGADNSFESTVGGAGAIYVFEKRNNESWIKHPQYTKITASTPSEYAYFGRSVAIDRNAIVVGAVGTYNNIYRSGSAYVFEKSSNESWKNYSQSKELHASDASVGDFFGSKVAIENGLIVIAGSNNREASLYIFSIYHSSFGGIETTKLSTSNLSSNSSIGDIDITNNIIVCTAYQNGNYTDGPISIYFFEQAYNSTESFILSASSFRNDGELLGESIAINGDTLVVGSPNKKCENNLEDCGAAYIFKGSSGL